MANVPLCLNLKSEFKTGKLQNHQQPPNINKHTMLVLVRYRLFEIDIISIRIFIFQ